MKPITSITLFLVYSKINDPSQAVESEDMKISTTKNEKFSLGYKTILGENESILFSSLNQETYGFHNFRVFEVIKIMCIGR